MVDGSHGCEPVNTRQHDMNYEASLLLAESSNEQSVVYHLIISTQQIYQLPILENRGWMLYVHCM